MNDNTLKDTNIKKKGRRKREKERRRQKQAEKAANSSRLHEETCIDLPVDWNNIFGTEVNTDNSNVSIPDALVLSLNNFGKVDIEYISSVTGADTAKVISALKGSIYQNPLTWDECSCKGWETADEYLSGNLVRKWNEAEEANMKYGGHFAANLIAIEKVLPPAVASNEIYVTLGSPWVPPDIIDEFIKDLFGDPFRHTYFYSEQSRKASYDALKTIHDDITGTWEIPNKSRYWSNVNVSTLYGTKRINALHIIEKTLNMKSIVITDEAKTGRYSSDKKRIVNKAETIAAVEKQKKLIKAFQNWIWKDPERKMRLQEIFEDRYSCVRRRSFDGSFLEFPTLSDKVSLYPYQKDAVARIIFTPNTLLAHDVGSGKTYVMIAAGQELRRMGLSKKNMYVVPNNIVGQWRDIFLEMYPEANLLCVDPKSFTPGKRKSVLEDMRDGDYDGIIIAYSCFELIPISRRYLIDNLDAQIREISRIQEQKGKTTSQLKRKKESLQKELDKAVVEMSDVAGLVCFDALGITRLFVDEAHNFKNVPVDTKSNVLGISKTGSKKCKDMLEKVRMVQKMNGGKGVVLATGTPITNSITDAYIMQQYLQSGELAMLDLQSFDAWIGMFAERKTEFEIDVDTSSYRLATRFSKFHNLPELTALLSSIADFHQTDCSAGIPTHDSYKDSLIPQTPAFTEYLRTISQRADYVRSGLVDRTEDNMLKITTDGRKAALDLRLAIPEASFTYSSKVAGCAENVADIYFRTAGNRSTQLIFCDTSTPKQGFNMYDELKKRLMLLGVPENQIFFIHDAETEAKRANLFNQIRNGDIRILIGSTFKLGLGVNIQDKLIALHHLDVPWRPADMTQREGRILRQGNENHDVEIHRYITEGSFDAYSWQLLETKQRFISELLSGSLAERSGSDIEDTVLNYAEVKALAVGNPLVKQRVEAANELSRYMSLQNKLIDSRMMMEKELSETPEKLKNQYDLIDKCKNDIKVCSDWKKNNPQPSDTAAKEAEAEKRKSLREFITEAVRGHYLEPDEKKLMTYRGFDIILPANMTHEKPYVILSCNGKYTVDLGDTETGNMKRIDNCLDTMNERLEKLGNGLARLLEKQQTLKAELDRNESYADQIEKFRQKVKELDKELGVDKDE